MSNEAFDHAKAMALTAITEYPWNMLPQRIYFEHRSRYFTIRLRRGKHLALKQVKYCKPENMVRYIAIAICDMMHQLDDKVRLDKSKKPPAQ